MPRFRLDHPHRPNVHAIYGRDPVIGFFCDLFIEGRSQPFASYDTWHPSFNRARPLMGCLDFLVAEGFFTGDELQDALMYLQDGSPEPKDMLVVEIVMEMKQTAD